MKVAPEVGQYLISPKGTVWRVDMIHPTRDPVYRLRSVTTQRARDMFLREMAQWHRAPDEIVEQFRDGTERMNLDTEEPK